MISKERLEELIKQDATIYWLIDNKIRKLPCKNIPTFWIKDNYNDYVRPFFETKEEAEWYKEFGCIERVERLELPTWEEFDEKKFIWFVDKNQNQCCLYYLNVSNKIFINISGEVIEIGELTKENYLLACRKAKELFLKGESK